MRLLATLRCSHFWQQGFNISSLLKASASKLIQITYQVPVKIFRSQSRAKRAAIQGQSKEVCLGHAELANLIAVGLSINLVTIASPVRSQANPPPPGAINSSLWVGPNPPPELPVGSAVIVNSVTVGGNALIQAELTSGSQKINGSIDASGSANIGGNAAVKGGLSSGSQTVNGDSTISGNVVISGALILGTPPELPPLPGEIWIHGIKVADNTGSNQGGGAMPSGSNQDCGNTSPSSICIGKDTKVQGDNATAIGSGASSVSGGTAIGAGASAGGQRSTAVGFGSQATDQNSTALGSGASAAHARSTAIGYGARTTTSDQVVIGRPGSRLALPGAASGGEFVGSANQNGPTRLLTADGEGNIGTSSFDPSAITGSIRALGQAVTSSGAIASAFSAVPQVVASEEETMRCGSGLGGYGSSYAAALGCSVKLNNQSPVHLNAAIAFTNPIDYQYGSSPGYAGRIGISFPLGPRNRQNKAGNSEEISALKSQIAELRNVINEMGLPVIGSNP